MVNFLPKSLVRRKILLTFAVAKSRSGAVVARQAHNLEVARSSRTSATKESPQLRAFLFVVSWGRLLQEELATIHQV